MMVPHDQPEVITLTLPWASWTRLRSRIKMRGHVAEKLDQAVTSRALQSDHDEVTQRIMFLGGHGLNHAGRSRSPDTEG
eukprot:3335436-Rhodomonas_salina.2